MIISVAQNEQLKNGGARLLAPCPFVVAVPSTAAHADGHVKALDTVAEPYAQSNILLQNVPPERAINLS
jgi:hypothetical protein